MGVFNTNKLSKAELLELVIAQKKKIEQMQTQIDTLQQTVSDKDQTIKELANLTQVTTVLVKLVKIMSKRLGISSGQTHG